MRKIECSQRKSLTCNKAYCQAIVKFNCKFLNLKVKLFKVNVLLHKTAALTRMKYGSTPTLSVFPLSNMSPTCPFWVLSVMT